MNGNFTAKKTCILFCALLVPLLLSAQTSWVKWWPQPWADGVWPENIVKTYDGGYAFHWSGDLYNPPYSIFYSMLYKTDSLGNVEWEVWGPDEYYNTLNLMPDSSLIWAGNYFITGITPDGQVDWKIRLDTLITPGARVYTATVTPDSNIVFIARKYYGSPNWWVFKLNTNGDTLWMKVNQFNFNSWPIRIQNLCNDNLVGCGHINGDSLLILKFNSKGDLYWQKKLVQESIGGSLGMILDNKNNIFLYGTGTKHIFYLDTLGSVFWNRYIQLPDTNLTVRSIQNMIKLKNRKLILTSYGFSSGQVNAIIQTDSLGNVLWWQSLPGNPRGFDVLFSKNNLVHEKNGYVVGISKFINGNHNIGIARMDSNGTITAVIDKKNQISSTVTLYQNYPNPFNSSTTIYFKLYHADYIEVAIFDLLGEKTETLLKGKLSAGKHRLIWNADKYSSGIYLCKLKFGRNQSVAKKIILIK